MAYPVRLRLLMLLLAVCPAAWGLEYLAQFDRDQVQINDVATDHSGNTYVCGVVSSAASLPGAIRLGGTNAPAGQADAFLMKFAADGSRVATIVFGGEGGDSAQNVAVDRSGNVVALGLTSSRGFPVLNGPTHAGLGGEDLFIIKFDSSCTNVIFSTLVGGIGDEFPTGLGLDGQGEIYFAGSTSSVDFLPGTDPFPWREGTTLSFFARLAGDGSEFRFLTRIGGSGSLNTISGLAVDEAGTACLVGSTSSLDFPTSQALQPHKVLSAENATAFVMKLAADGTTLFSTFLSGDVYDEAKAVAVNATGEVFIAGRTYSQTFPALGAGPLLPGLSAGAREFLIKLDPAGTRILDTRFFHVSGFDDFRAIAIPPDQMPVGVFNDDGGLGVPYFANLGSAGAVTIAGRPPCDGPARVRRMAFDSMGRLVVVGDEAEAQGQGQVPILGEYVARYAAGDLPGLSEAQPQVRILSPVEGMRLASGKPGSVFAAVVGATGAVGTVRFYDGRRLVGVATNVPFQTTWTNVLRGEHHLKAVATINGRSVTSCVVNVTGLSPKNDDFARRSLLKGPNVETAGDTTGASQEPDEQSGFSLSVWYTWKAPRDGVYRFEVSEPLAGDGISHYLRLYSGSQFKSLVSRSEARASVTLRASAREAFQIQVAGFTGASGPFRLRIRSVTPPANDNFATPISLSGESVSVVATTRDATSESPGFPGQIGYGTAGTPDIWFLWTAPASGPVLATAEGLTVSCAVGNSISNLSLVGQRIFGETNGLAFYAQAGMSYHLAIQGENTNDVLLRLRPYAPPVNDDFAQRLVLASGDNAVTGTLIGATTEYGEPGNFFTPVPSVWWTWHPPTSGVYRVAAVLIPNSSPGISLFGTPRPGSPALRPIRTSIYTGEVLAQLSPVSSPEVPAPIGDPVFWANAETDYQIAVTGGAARFLLRILPGASADNDEFASAAPLAGANVAQVGSTFGATAKAWYRWTAPTNGIYSFSARPAQALEIYRGDVLGELIPLATGSDTHLLEVTAGVEYRLAVIEGGRFTLSIRPAQRPDNDDFSNRRVISGLNVQFGVDAQDATAESEEPPFMGNLPVQHSVWFSWIAPTNGSYLLRSTNFMSPRISVYTGDTLAGLTRVAAGQDYGGLEFSVVAGSAYQIAIEPDPFYYERVPGGTVVELELAYRAPPRNDDFSKRVRLNGAPVSITASNQGATMELAEPLGGPWAGGQTVWWTWRAPRAGRATFLVEALSISGILNIYTGSTLAQLIPLTDTNANEAAYNLQVQAGKDYQIAVDRNIWSSSGEFRLRIYYTSAPPNDDFARRRAFTTTVAGNLEGGGLEANEPGVSASNLTSSVWWTWTAPSNGMYRFDLLAQTFGLGLELFSGNALTNLEQVPSDPWYFASSLLVQVTAGHTYVLRATGRGVPSPFTLSATYAPAPVNDQFTNRIALTGTDLSIVGSNRTASAEASEPAHGGTAARKSVWWSWTAPANGVAHILLLRSYQRIAVYVGDSLESLQPVTNGVGTADFEGTSGVTYQIAIDVAGVSLEGWDAFSWTLRLAPPLAPAAALKRPAGLGPVLRSTPTGTIIVLNPANCSSVGVLRVVETSTNLIDWVPYPNTGAIGNWDGIEITPNTNEPCRFFRVR
ncbi:MAG TPA: Ig-like domain-containing protein [Verrucomicrobiae bacterium]|nr:Ig-like domain-containing protein [Verrucomicrobiae bacterium]